MRLKDNVIKMTDTFVKADNNEIETKVQAEIIAESPINEDEVIQKNTVAKKKKRKEVTDQ